MVAVPPNLAPYVTIIQELRSELGTIDQREALMATIYEQFSERNLAVVLAEVFEQDRHVLLAEAIDAYARLRDSNAADSMRLLLTAHGWDFDDDGLGPAPSDSSS